MRQTSFQLNVWHSHENLCRYQKKKPKKKPKKKWGKAKEKRKIIPVIKCKVAQAEGKEVHFRQLM